MNAHRFFKPFVVIILTSGAAALVFSAARMPQQQLDWRFLLLLVGMAIIASRLSIPIPHVKGEVTVGDTLIFLTLMLYDGEAAVLMAAVDGLSSSLYVSRKPRVWLFNSAQMAVATSVTVWTLRLCFGPILDFNRAGNPNRVVAAVCVMALVQYLSNSGLVAIYTALKTNQPLYSTWRNSYFWTSLSYFAGASVASIAARLVSDLSVYAAMMITPIVAIIYFTYKTYLKNVQNSVDKAEQAKRHVAELSKYIEEQERTNLALTNAMPGISILNSEGRYERVNEAYAEMVGSRPEEMIGMDWTPTVADDDRVHAIAAYERMLTEGKAEFEAQGVRKNGSLFYKHVLMVKRTDTDGNFLGHHCFMRDISERRRMEQEREVIFAVSQGVFTTQDLDELLTLVHESISKVLYAENCFVTLYDEATDLMKFQFWVDKFDPCPAPRPIGAGFSSYVLRTGQPLLVDRELTEEMVRRGEVKQSGTMSASWIGVPLKTSERTIGVLVVQHYEDEDAYSQKDVDFLSSVAGQIAMAIERKRAEEELSTQRRFLRQVIDLNPSFIFAKDQEGRFTLVNQALAEAYGTTVEGLLGKSDADFNPNKEEVEWFRRDDLEVMNSGKEKFIPEEVITDAAGNTRWLQTIKRPIISFDGTAKQVLGVATDVTQRKKAEAALRESEEMLRQAQKMESIGTLAGGIAHDFNNLMTAVTGYSELALRRLGPDDPLRPNIEEVKKAGERAATLTRQLLAFSRKQLLQPVVLDLNAIVTGIGKMLPRLIGEDIDLRFELSGSLGQIEADPGQMEQVLMNLAVNARDAMPSGGRLTIKTENVKFAGRFVKHRMVVEPGNYVVLSVSDTGVGMDAETQSQIFEPFFTTKEIGKGTGLGLATVYGIVKQSDGSIWVYSEPGKGSTFRVFLPRANEVAQSEAVDQAGDREAQAGPVGHETILLVEDEETVRNLAKEVLEECGYRLLTASNGDEGLRAYREHSDKIDLVITDVVMPKMSGRQLAERIRAIRPETRVLYMSGFTDDAVVRHGVQADDICFIQKPFSPEALAIKARELLDHNGSNGEESTKLEPQSSNSLEKSTYGYHPLNR